ncbi:hypothetical protein [Sphingosinicella sp. BN140058]|uniref:hypothetical protein n=1 Tax=Sphingosinicella sp. BN140058 TaxID=1892855 RepID=UPI001011E5FC|nr:hypothetical protein [Sphingosinicella sp. BN140058]QAY77235.1 hypothetical protein ETR14_12545 [Sphingosinicella sp. BN140058]
MPEEEKLPLHDEAKARAKWRGGETILDKGDAAELPASEVDAAAQGDGASPDAPRVDLRPPD